MTATLAEPCTWALEHPVSTPDGACRPLAQWPLRTPGVITAPSMSSHDGQRKIQHRLAELGFVCGETVMIMARSAWRDGPIVVRVGHSTFALRAHEASLLHVVPQQGQA